MEGFLQAPEQAAVLGLLCASHRSLLREKEREEEREEMILTDLIKRADAYAAEKHKGQLRKYTGVPYIEHPREVAMLVSVVTDGNPVLVASALLHDVCEDCGVGLSEIAEEFGEYVALNVQGMTDISKPTDGNRAVRKAIDRLHIQGQSPNVKTIKIADMISNTRTIAQFDPGFAKIYMREKRALLEVLGEGNEALLREARRQVENYFKENPE